MPRMPRKRGTEIWACAVTSSISGGCRNQSGCAITCFTASMEVLEPSTARRIFMRRILRGSGARGLQLVQEAVADVVDPAVHGEVLAARPGLAQHGGLADVQH